MAINENLFAARETNDGQIAAEQQSSQACSRADGKARQTGVGAMLKTVSAVAAAALIAAGIVILPSLSPQVEAGVPPASGKSDRADFRPLATDCSQREWPYFEASCLRDSRNAFGQAHEARFVPLDSMHQPAGRTALAGR